MKYIRFFNKSEGLIFKNKLHPSKIYNYLMPEELFPLEDFILIFFLNKMQESQLITLKVGGKLFKTKRTTLCNSEYFNGLINDTNIYEEIFTASHSYLNLI